MRQDLPVGPIQALYSGVAELGKKSTLPFLKCLFSVFTPFKVSQLEKLARAKSQTFSGSAQDGRMASMDLSTPGPVSAPADSAAHHGLGIKTPLPVSTTHVEVDMTAPAPSPAATRHKVVGKFIPAAGYTVPTPTWRVKPQFAAWEIDHMRFEVSSRLGPLLQLMLPMAPPQVKRLLGKGSYGSVAEAFDHLTNQRVAIKKIANVFDVFENAKRIYREVRSYRVILRATFKPRCEGVAGAQPPSPSAP